MKPFSNRGSFRKRRGTAMLPIASVCAFCTLQVNAADWPSWRGPDGTGSIVSGVYPIRWDGTNVLWKAALPGKGSSTPIVWKDHVYVTAPMEGEDGVLAFDLSGKLLWQTKLGAEAPPKHRTLGSSCNASPVTDGQSVYAYFKSGNFAALDLDGHVRWQTNLIQRFGPERIYWDQGSSPTLTDRHVVLARMHSGESWIAGFDKTNGELRWRQTRNYNVPSENDNGYTTPLLFQEGARKALLIWGADHLTAHDATDGKLLWSCDGFNPDGTGNWPAIATPVIASNLAIVPVGRDDRRQGRLYAVQLGGSGEITETHRAWKRTDVGVFVSSPVAYKGRVYLLRHRGEVACIDPTNGRTLWSDAFPRDKSSYFSSPLIAGGQFYAAREDGVVFVARVENGFELLSENPMGERIIASPVPVDGRLLLRGDRHLFCIQRD